MFYVYQLTDPRTKLPFYVGKGKNNRAAAHITEAKRSPDKWSNVRKCQYIRNLWDMGLSPLLEYIVTNVTEQEALDCELLLIHEHGRLHDGSGILTNMHAHNAPSNKKSTPVAAYTISGALVGSYPSLTVAAQTIGVHKSTLCAALNKRCSTAGGFRWFHAGEPFSYSPHSGTPVDQYNFNGELIASYESQQIAANATSVLYSQLADCCAGRASAAGGYQWAYRGELPRHPVTPRMVAVNSDRELVASDATGDIVGVYDSIKAAVQDTNANATGISDCCASRKKTSGGLSWKWRIKKGG